MTLAAMTAPQPIPPRIILINVALVLLWLPLIFAARALIDKVSGASPSADLLQAAYLAVVGTLAIITAAYVFGLVLLNKFMTQNLGGAQPRIVRPLVLGAFVLYAVAGVVAFMAR